MGCGGGGGWFRDRVVIYLSGTSLVFYGGPVTDRETEKTRGVELHIVILSEHPYMKSQGMRASAEIEAKAYTNLFLTNSREPKAAQKIKGQKDYSKRHQHALEPAPADATNQPMHSRTGIKTITYAKRTPVLHLQGNHTNHHSIAPQACGNTAHSNCTDCVHL